MINETLLNKKEINPKKNSVNGILDEYYFLE